MPKAKKKTKKKTAKKRTVTCGKCKDTGHNARTCPTKESAVAVATTEAPPSPVKTLAPKEEKPRSKRDRPAPTADRGTAATAAPYRCVKCNQVAILLIVRVKDHNESFKKKKDIFKGEMRCEQCMNKPSPAELILVWGATPDQKVTSEVANA